MLTTMSAMRGAIVALHQVNTSTHVNVNGVMEFEQHVVPIECVVAGVATPQDGVGYGDDTLEMLALCVLLTWWCGPVLTC